MENSITTLHRRQQLARVTSGMVSAIAPTVQIAFGDGGVDSEGNPIPPLPDATGLQNEVARYPLDSAVHPPGPGETPMQTRVRYTATIPANDLAGVSISEAGLVDADGLYTAVKTFFVKRKDGGVAFMFDFDDIFDDFEEGL